MGWNEGLERMRARLHRRAFGYRALFFVSDPSRDRIDMAPWWAFWRPPRPGEISPAAEIVLRDLAHYCYAGKSTLKLSPVDQHVDPLAMAFAEGRRDVFNRIVAMCNFTPEQIEQIARSRSTDE